jgi:hypothetical protein
VEERNLLVLMCMHELVVEFGVEVGVDRGDRLLFGEDVAEVHGFVVLGLALLGETFGAKDFGIGVGLMPGAEEDVVL